MTLQLVPSSPIQELENSIYRLRIISKILDDLSTRADKAISKIDSRLENIRTRFSVSSQSSLPKTIR